jgi:hypothetical protein
MALIGESVNVGIGSANAFISMKTTIAIYKETNTPKPAGAPEKYVDRSYLSEALKGPVVK